MAASTLFPCQRSTNELLIVVLLLVPWPLIGRGAPSPRAPGKQSARRFMTICALTLPPYYPTACASTALVQSPLPSETVIFGTIILTVPIGFSFCFDWFCADVMAGKCMFSLKDHSICVSYSPKCLFFHPGTL